MGSAIAIAAGVMGALGVFCALCLGVSARFLSVRRDPKVDALEAIFGGSNCGACGYPACAEAAVAVVNNTADVDVCVPGGRAVMLSVARYMDKKPAPKKRDVPVIVPLQPHEIPVIDAANCIRCGLCARACTWGAIDGEPKTLPKIDLDMCTLCGACVTSCKGGYVMVKKWSEVFR